MQLQDSTAVINAERPGLYQIKAGESMFSFTSNVLCREESDLAGCDSGFWGNWSKDRVFSWEYRNIAWIFLLAAMALLTIHMLLVARSGGRGG